MQDRFRVVLNWVRAIVETYCNRKGDRAASKRAIKGEELHLGRGGCVGLQIVEKREKQLLLHMLTAAAATFGL